MHCFSPRTLRISLALLAWLLAALNCALPSQTSLSLEEQIAATMQSLTQTAAAIPTDAPQPSDTAAPGETQAPSDTPEPEGPWMACEDAPPSQLHIGDQAYVSFDPPECNRVRKDPNKNTGAVLGNICPGEMVEILDGPACANQWVWWKVQSLESDLTGWTVEGDASAYWLIPSE
jgi:hypothetical protein